MQSKRSSFDLTLFRKNLSRSWPLWGGLSILGSLFPLYMLLSMLNSPRTSPYEAQEFAELLFNAVTILGPTLAAGYAILCAMLVWSYLDIPRAVGFMHTLPVHRSSLFLTNAASGMTMLLIPYVVVGAGFSLVTLCWGALPLLAVLETAALVILMNLLFFGMATFCAMVTGSIFAMPVLYVVVNFLAPLMSLLTDTLASTYLVGIESADPSPLSIAFAPVVQIYESFRFYSEWIGDQAVSHLEGQWVVCVYGLVGIALLGLSWLLYRARRSESAGDVVAFRWLRPVFRFGLALLSAVTLGWLLYVLLWGELFQRGAYTDPVPMAACMVLTGLVGYYAASMLLEKSLRVFQNTWKGALVVCAGAAALNAALAFDLAGRESWVPDAEDVQRVELWSGGDLDLTCEAGLDDGLLEKIVAFHGDLAADRDAIRDTQNALRRGAEGRHDWANVTIHYTLKNGRTARRYYQLICPEDWAASPMAYDDLLVNFSRDIDVQLQQVSTPWGMELDSVYVSSPTDQSGDPDAGESRLVYDALLRDVRAGNLPGWEPFAEDAEGYYDYAVELGFRELPQKNWSGDMEDSKVYTYTRSSHKRIRLAPSMTETMDALVELELLSREELDRWAETYGTPNREKFPEVSTDLPAARGD